VLITPSAQNAEAFGVCQRGELICSPGLPDSRLSGQHDDLSSSRQNVVQGGGQLAHLEFTADEI
jgi:hypothetical protein